MEAPKKSKIEESAPNARINPNSTEKKYSTQILTDIQKKNTEMPPAIRRDLQTLHLQFQKSIQIT